MLCFIKIDLVDFYVLDSMLNLSKLHLFIFLLYKFQLCPEYNYINWLSTVLAVFNLPFGRAITTTQTQ